MIRNLSFLSKGLLLNETRSSVDNGKEVKSSSGQSDNANELANMRLRL